MIVSYLLVSCQHSPASIGKVCALSWQLLLDRIPSRSNLSRRGIIMSVDSMDCLMCWQPMKNSISHVFILWICVLYLICSVSMVQFVHILPRDLLAAFSILVWEGKCKKSKGGLIVPYCVWVRFLFLLPFSVSACLVLL